VPLPTLPGKGMKVAAFGEPLFQDSCYEESFERPNVAHQPPTFCAMRDEPRVATTSPLHSWRVVPAPMTDGLQDTTTENESQLAARSAGSACWAASSRWVPQWTGLSLRAGLARPQAPQGSEEETWKIVASGSPARIS